MSAFNPKRTLRRGSMNSRVRLGVVLATLLVCGSAHACSEPEVPTFRQSLDSASRVFVARIVSIGLADSDPGSRQIAGRIEVVRVLKGAPQFRHFTHNAVACGGLRLAVGHYYLIATRQDGAVLALVRGDRSIVDVSDDYSRNYPPKRPDQLWQTDIANYLAGRQMREGFDPREIMERVQAFPPPPGQAW